MEHLKPNFIQTAIHRPTDIEQLRSALSNNQSTQAVVPLFKVEKVIRNKESAIKNRLKDTLASGHQADLHKRMKVGVPNQWDDGGIPVKNNAEKIDSSEHINGKKAKASRHEKQASFEPETENTKMMISDARYSSDVDRLTTIADGTKEYKVLAALAQNPNITPEIACKLIQKSAAIKCTHKIMEWFTANLNIINDKDVFKAMNAVYHCNTNAEVLQRTWIEYIDVYGKSIEPALLLKLKDFLGPWIKSDLEKRIDSCLSEDRSSLRSKEVNNFGTLTVTFPFKAKQELLNHAKLLVFEKINACNEEKLSLDRFNVFWEKFKNSENASWRLAQKWLHPDKYPFNSEDQLLAQRIFPAANEIFKENKIGQHSYQDMYDALQ